MRSADLGRGLAATLAACAALLAQPAAASGWPNALPAQPLVQAERLCAPGVVPLSRRCHVADFTKLGETPDGRAWYYAFYATRWADRHGRMERGFPVLFYLQGAATLRLGLWINDEPGLAGRWATTPPPRPVMLLRPEGDFVGFTLKAIRGPDDQRLFRRDKLRWKEIDVLHRQDADQARLDAVTPHGCEAADDGVYDWAGFRLLLPLRESLSHAPCGFISADLAIRETRLSLTGAIYSRAELKDHPPQTGDPMSPPLLTPAPVGHTSPLR